MDKYLTSLFEGAENKAQEQQKVFEEGRQQDSAMWHKILLDPNSSSEQRTRAAGEIGKLRNLKKGENPFTGLADHLNTLGSHLRERGGIGNKILGTAASVGAEGLKIGTNMLTGTPGQKQPSLPPLDPNAAPNAQQINDQNTKLAIDEMTQKAAAQRGIDADKVKAEVTQAESVLGRPLEETEKAQILKIAPKAGGRVIWTADKDGKLVANEDRNGVLYPIEVPQGQTPVLPSTLPTQSSSKSTYDPDTGTTNTTRTSGKVVPKTNDPKSNGSQPAHPKSLPGNPSSSGKAGGRVAAMADDWMKSGVVPGTKDKSAVEKYMKDKGMEPGTKPTAAEIKLRDDIKKVGPMVDRLSGFLEDNKLTESGRGGMFSFDAWTERGKVQKAWEEYSHGLTPSDKKLGELIKYAAAIKIMGASPWMSIGRGKYIYSEVVQHLPEPTDTPAQLYDKINFFRTVLDDAKGSLPTSLQDKNSLPPLTGGAGAPANPYR